MCKHFETVDVPPGEWDTYRPDCPVCASTEYHQEFVAPGILSVRNVAAHMAEKVAEAQEAHQRDTGIRAAEEAMKAENFTREAKRIVEHARELGQLQPMVTDSGIGRTSPVPINSPAVQSAIAFSQAERRRTGALSPAEALISDIKTGRAPDMWNRFRRNCDPVK